MSKTKRKEPPKKAEHEASITKLKSKLQDRKAQVRRLKGYVEELKQKLIKAGKPPVEDKLPKPVKMSDEEKEILKTMEAEQKKRALIDKMKAKYGRKENGST